MMDAMLLPLRRYADFRGRSGRTEFWSFTLASFAALVSLSVVLGTLGSAVGGSNPGSRFIDQVFQLSIVVGCLGLLLPQLAVTVRRLHDQGRTGWFILLTLVPLVGGLLLLILLALPGEAAGNAYGMPFQGSSHVA